MFSPTLTAKAVMCIPVRSCGVDNSWALACSNLRSRRGAAYRLLRTVRWREIPFALSVALVLEYEDALGRPDMIPDLPRPAVMRFLDA